ncbi:MAG TPA: hypothetical protein GXX46_01310 [Peptococcaceae bacterium]|nr:hypothetical protein [Peptococcaceae bacterium]
MFSRKSHNNNWMMISSALLGGFLLGFSYKKYGKDLVNRIQNIGTFSRRKYDFDDDYMTSHEPDA